MAKKQHGLTALPLGGLGEIGMNMMVYECDGEMIIADIGMTLPNFATEPGADLVIPDITYVRERIKRLKGIFITHAHEDHIGGLQYVWDDLPDAPVFVTPFARCVLEHKLSEMGITDFEDRLVTVNYGDKVDAGCFNVEYVEVTHSTLESSSLILRTPHGIVVHTGDYKLDNNPGFGNKSNVKRLKEVGDEGVLAMLADSTNIFVEGNAGSEGDMLDRLDDRIGGIKGRIFFATFSSNVGRLIKIIELAAKHGRKVCCLSRSTINMVNFAKDSGYFPKNLENTLVEVDQASGMKPSKVLVLASGTQGETNSALSSLALGRVVKGLTLGAKDTVIMSSRFIPGNERTIYNLINNLLKTGANVITDNKGDIHVSGHGGRAETKEMYALLRPQIAVPVHGEYAHLLEHSKFAKEIGVPTQLLITNGKKVYLGPDAPHVVEKENPVWGRNYIDGLNILDDDAYILTDRRKMAFEGLAHVVQVVESATQKMVGYPIVKTKGVIDEDLQRDVLDEASQEAGIALDKLCADGVIENRKQAEDVMRQAVRRTFGRMRKRKPVTIATIVEI